MSNPEFLSELLGIANLRATGTEFTSAEQIKHIVESVDEAGVCPACQQISIQIHGQSEEQRIRDLAYGERRCYLSYRAHRLCSKTFVERAAWKRPEAIYTVRYENYIYQRSRKEPVRQIAEEEGLSEEAVQAMFEHRAKNDCGTRIPASPGAKRAAR